MPAPTMTPEQRAAALEKARVVRAKRSEITNKLAMGLTTPAEVLDQIDDPIIGRMKVKAFVNALPGFGKVKTEKLMEELGIPARASSAGPRLQPDGRSEGRPFLSLNRGNLCKRPPIIDGRFCFGRNRHAPSILCRHIGRPTARCVRAADRGSAAQ